MSSSKSRPVIVMAAVLAGLQVLAGGAALSDMIGKQAFGLFVLVVAAIQVGWGVYVQGVVTPWSAVVAKAVEGGGVVAGPAARASTGTPVVVSTAAGRDVVAPPADDAGIASLVLIGIVVLVIGLIVLLTGHHPLGWGILIVGAIVAFIGAVMPEKRL